MKISESEINALLNNALNSIDTIQALLYDETEN
jgi:hypothetical protein